MYVCKNFNSTFYKWLVLKDFVCLQYFFIYFNSIKSFCSPIYFFPSIYSINTKMIFIREQVRDNIIKEAP